MTTVLPALSVTLILVCNRSRRQNSYMTTHIQQPLVRLLLPGGPDERQR